jgi:hypothetical protein
LSINFARCATLPASVSIVCLTFFWSAVKILLVDAAHRLAGPIGRATTRDGEADIGESLIDFGHHVMRTVLVATMPTVAVLPKVG